MDTYRLMTVESGASLIFNAVRFVPFVVFVQKLVLLESISFVVLIYILQW